MKKKAEKNEHPSKQDEVEKKENKKSIEIFGGRPRGEGHIFYFRRKMENKMLRFVERKSFPGADGCVSLARSDA